MKERERERERERGREIRLMKWRINRGNESVESFNRSKEKRREVKTGPKRERHTTWTHMA